jgi:hypothetical protein
MLYGAGLQVEASMAETTPLPEAWIGQEVNITYIGAGKTNDVNCKITEVNDQGVGVERGGGTKSSFFPWTSIVRIDLGYASQEHKKLRLH